MGAVVDHCGERIHILAVANLSEEVLADDDEGDAGRAYVLLCTAVDDAILLHVDGAAHDVGRHIGHEGYGAVHVVLDFRAVDGIVGGDVEVVSIGRNFVILGYIGIGLVLRRSDDYGLPEVLGFLGGLLCPYTGLEIGGLLLEEVGRQGKELCAGTATEEEHFVLFGDVQQFAPELACLCHHTFPSGGTVRDFEKSDTGSVEVADSLDCGLDCFFGQHAGSCIEIVLFHKKRFYWLMVGLCVFLFCGIPERDGITAVAVGIRQRCAPQIVCGIRPVRPPAVRGCGHA